MELTLDQALLKGVEAHKAGKVHQAKYYYTAILNVQPKHPDTNHNMGVLAVGVGKVEEALPFYKAALEANPKIAQFWLSYIDALIKLDRMADAKEVLEQAKSQGLNQEGLDLIEKQLKSSPSQNSSTLVPPQEQLQILENLYSRGHYQEALNKSSELLEQFPNSINLYNIIGVTNQSLGKLEGAIKAYTKSLSINPNNADAYNNIGVVFRVQGKLEKAIEAFKKAIIIKPDYAEAYNNMGDTLQMQGNLEKAIEAFNKAISLKPLYSDAYYNMGVVFKIQGKLEKTVEAFNKAISIKPDYAEAYNNMGNAFADQGKLEEAIEAYNKVISLNPRSADAYSNIGATLKKQGKLDEAIEAYDKVISLNPDNGTAKHILSALTGNKNESAPRDYVENLFDGYSTKFEASLVNELEYKTPKLIRDILIKPNINESLGSIMDLGCGTGLFGLEIRNHCSKLEGIDLSSKMLDLAKQKNVYDNLSHYDIVDYLSSVLLDYDYYIALDVFIYVGDLSEIFRLIRSRNRKSGKLVFSTEHTEKDGYHILQTGRYSHSKSYIESLCKKFGYKISHFSTTKLRKEKSSFLTGGIYILEFGNKI